MKKVLVCVLCALCVSFVASAKEYNLDQTQKCQESLLCNLENEPLTGTVKEYDANENLKSESSYFNGRKNGVSRSYYENGNLKNEAHYVYDTKVGMNKKYYENGTLKAELSYKNGQKNGTSKMYNEDGELKAEILFKNGKAVSGTMYEEDGRETKMTNAHLHAVDKGKLPTNY